jgi:DinB superfamily
MKRSQLNPVPEYFDRYINKCDDTELIDAIQTSIEELDALPLDPWKTIGDKVYAPGKWTIKDILQHLIDTERIFTYRALVFARNEKQQPPSFEEDDYAKEAAAGKRSLDDLIEELKAVHMSFKKMYLSFTPKMLARMGKGFKGLYSVAAIGFCMPGHQRWHLGIIKEKYMPLLDK